jgi:hypothetical protein
VLYYCPFISFSLCLSSTTKRDQRWIWTDHMFTCTLTPHARLSRSLTLSLLIRVCRTLSLVSHILALILTHCVFLPPFLFLFCVICLVFLLCACVCVCVPFVPAVCSLSLSLTFPADSLSLHSRIHSFTLFFPCSFSSDLIHRSLSSQHNRPAH